jgi:L-aminopeptidase/D-esterase-like protein
MTTRNSVTAIEGITVGHATDLEAGTGCTVILCPEGTVGGVDQRGGAPGTRETDLLRPLHVVEHVDAIVLAGGSAYGLAAADGVMHYLRERERGYRTRSGVRVPIVPAAILYDLEVGRADRFPDAAMGYRAAESASDDDVTQGSIGVGTGCRIAALFGNARATKGGIGSAAVYLPGGLIVAALIAVNTVGEVLAEDGTILAGLRAETGVGYTPILEALKLTPPPTSSNTVIGVIATNAKLSKEHTNIVAQMAHDGLARAVRPSHTLYDGDTLFALSTGQVLADTTLVGAFAAEMTARAIRDAVLSATSLGGVIALRQAL